MGKGEVTSTTKILLRVRTLRNTPRAAKSQAELDLGEERKAIPSRAITMEIRREQREMPSPSAERGCSDRPPCPGLDAPQSQALSLPADRRDSLVPLLLPLPPVREAFLSTQVPDTFSFFSG